MAKKNNKKKEATDKDLQTARNYISNDKSSKEDLLKAFNVLIRNANQGNQEAKELIRPMAKK